MILTQEIKPSELKQGRPHEPHVHFITNRVKKKEKKKNSSKFWIERLLAMTGSESRGKCPEQQMGLC